MKRDDLVDSVGQVFGGEQGDFNHIWYRLANQDYVYSGWVQSVSTTLNPVVTEIPDTGMLESISIPYAESSYGINISLSPCPRLYYATTHWVTGVIADKRDGSL